MPELSIAIRPFDLTGASPDEYAALNRHVNQAKAETLPDDPPTPLDERIAQMQNIPSFTSVRFWAGWNPDATEIVAGASVTFLQTDDNAHLAEFEIHVHRDHRERGIGRELFRRIAEASHQEGRRLMITDTSEHIPAGEAFMRRLGAERGLELHTNQLLLSEVDTALISRWQDEGQERAPGFTIGFWDGPYPEDQIESIAALIDVMNTAPRENLDVEDAHIPPDQIRQMEQTMKAAGTQRWTVYAIETATGRFAGFTEVYWNPNRPQIVTQGGTAVFPSFRGRGLGRWLKAAMLGRILRDRPTARFVRTGNADSNAVMLGINHALGFKPYLSRCVWQLETEKALIYLSGSRA